MDDNLMLIKQFQMQGGSKGADAAFAEEYRNYQQIQNVYMGAIREIRARLETLDTEFQYRHKHNPIHHIQSRVKTLPSIMKKLSDMGQPMTITSAKKHLHDIAGVRVVCCYVDDIYRIAELLLSQDDISLIFEKDYIKQPKPNGYRSLHIVVDVPVYLSQGKLFIPVEIQIRTVAMDFWPRSSTASATNPRTKCPPSSSTSCATARTSSPAPMPRCRKFSRPCNC